VKKEPAPILWPDQVKEHLKQFDSHLSGEPYFVQTIAFMTDSPNDRTAPAVMMCRGRGNTLSGFFTINSERSDYSEILL
jgi:hypothetical protein